MTVREIQARTLLSSAARPDPWFGIKHTMNLYRGCTHRCIYCDSRSQCYGIEDFDGEVLVKANGIALLRRELARKRSKGYISTGSMNDAYQPLERELQLTRQALAVIAEHRFPVHILTKSDLVLRDGDLLAGINERASGDPSGPSRAAGTAGAVVSFTITTMDDDLARQLEPGAAPPSRRLAALAALAGRGIRTGVMLMPVLPFIEDNEANISAVVTQAAEAGASYVVPAFGMTLRDRQRAYYLAQLDRLFPGLRGRYERAFGERYSAPDPNAARLQALFAGLAGRFGLATRVAPYAVPGAAQLSLF